MLKGEGIILRGLEYEDLKLLHIWMNDFDMITDILRIEPSVKFFTEKWYEKMVTDKSKKIFAIEEQKTGKFIGCIGVSNIDYIHRKAELYIYIGDRKFRGKGYGKRAMNAFLKYMFQYYNLHKIYLHVRCDNIRAIHLYKAIGFKEEGCFKRDVYIEGKYIDIFRLGLLKDEWIK